MAESPYSREIKFDSVFNFRDIGGYHTFDGHTVAWRRVFRSANLGGMTSNDLNRMTSEVGLRSVLDLRGKSEVEKQGVGLLSGSGIAYYNISLAAADREGPNEGAFQGLKHMGELYFNLTRQEEVGERLVKALSVVSEPANCPLVFSCFIGKDRTGMLAAFLLSVLNVADDDISDDYSLSTAYSEVLRNRMKSNPNADTLARRLPDYAWEASPGSMRFFLAAIRREYGSPREYLQRHGAEPSLFDQLEETLLVRD